MSDNYFSKLLFKNDIKYFLLHPVMFALYVWLAILCFTPNYFEKYKIEIVDYEVRRENDKVFYSDLNGDGASEIIRSAYHESGNERIPFVLYSDINNKTINEWAFFGDWLFYYNIYFDDFDNNGYEEAYFFTMYNDSLFLFIKELMLDEGIDKSRFVCKIGDTQKKVDDVRDIDATFVDIDNDGYKEFIFSLRAGYSKFPRNTFRYNIAKDEIIMSPLSASGFLLKYSLMDITGDSIAEITSLIPANENIHYELPYTDSSSWLMVMNPETMDFVFPPKEINKGIGSTIYPVFNLLDNKVYITARSLINTVSSNKHYLELMVFDTTGNLLNKKEVGDISKKEMFDFIDLGRNSNHFYLIDNLGNIFSTDLNLELKKILEVDIDISDIFHHGTKKMDVDEDGLSEFFFIGHKNLKYKLLIYNNDFSNCSYIDLMGAEGGPNWIVNKIEGKSEPMFYLQTGKYGYTLTYSESRFYYLKYPAYFLIYVILFLFFWLLQSMQNKIAMKTIEEEKLLMKQQMALSKKQLEPHFMLNTLNNMGNMFAKEEKDDAQYYFGKFASLLHRGLIYADKSETSLYEELEFARDYLALQKRRYSDLLYSVDVDENIDINKIYIPHSLIYTFVENALKHGLLSKDGNKRLWIIVRKNNELNQIIIRDNGIGRKKSKQIKTTGTNKGIVIITNIIRAYNKLNNRKISFKVIDLEEGVEVIITV